jgi:hypothetical protein
VISCHPKHGTVVGIIREFQTFSGLPSIAFHEKFCDGNFPRTIACSYSSSFAISKNISRPKYVGRGKSESFFSFRTSHIELLAPKRFLSWVAEIQTASGGTGFGGCLLWGMGAGPAACFRFGLVVIERLLVTIGSLFIYDLRHAFLARLPVF